MELKPVIPEDTYRIDLIEFRFRILPLLSPPYGSVNLLIICHIVITTSTGNRTAVRRRGFYHLMYCFLRENNPVHNHRAIISN